MSAKDIGSNRFYNLMLDPTKSLPDKHKALEDIFNAPLPAQQMAEAQQDYKDFQEFLRRKQSAVDNGLKDLKNREFKMEQGLAAGDRQDVEILAQQQQSDIERLKNAVSQLDDILSTMFSAEGKIKASKGVPSTDTTGIYMEIQAQQNSLQWLETSLGNTHEELDGTQSNNPFHQLPAGAFGTGADNDNDPEPAAAVPVVLKEIFVASTFGKLTEDISAPPRAVFKKKPTPGSTP